MVLAGLAPAAEPIRLHPENPKYFLFRGKPLVLVTATEHYGSVINRAFNFERYLDGAAGKKMTLTRTFLLFREQQGSRNPASPCKPESPDFIAPYPRTGPGKAMDGEPVYDLDQWNPEYFDRLHRFLRKASEKGIVVELTLLSNTYSDAVWALNPLRAENNRQGIGKVHFLDYNSLRDPALAERQMAYARKIIQETAQYDNVYYEICNEPGGGFEGHATVADVNAWQAEVSRVVREEMRRLGSTHLIFGQETFTWSPKFIQTMDLSFRAPWLDAVNVHPLPNTVLGGHTYEMGNFMSKELTLRDLAAFTRAAWPLPKPMVHDEDNAASLYRDLTGWTIHRKRAWTSVLNGAHYDYIDFSITAGSEAGTPQSRAAIRSWMKHLSEFIHSFDFVHAKPASGWVKGLPGHVVTSGLAVDGNDYIAYLADAREITEAGAGEPIRGRVTLDLPAGRYAVSLYSPVTGEVSPAMFVSGGQPAALDLLPFRHDIVVRAQRLLPPVRVYADGRPATTLRMDAEDSGPIIRHGDGPGKCDYLGAREAIAFQAGDTYYLHYDGAGPRGWVACLATSKDLKKWDLRGPALELGAPGEDDSGTASSPWTIFDGKWWHMFYVACRNTTPPPNRIPAVPYFTRKARSRSPLGPWEKQRDVIPFDTKPETFYSDTASPGQIVKHNGEYLMFFSAAAGRPLKRTLGIARTRNLDGPWRIDANPALPPEQQVENSALYYEPSNQTWFLFTNHIGLDRRGEYTESIWVYWSKDLNKWDPEKRAVVLDDYNCRWNVRCLGMPSVVKVGNRLALFYDAPAQDTGDMGRDIGLAWLQLPLKPPNP